MKYAKPELTGILLAARRIQAEEKLGIRSDNAGAYVTASAYEADE
jgi:hypothetical protein